jgi:hypothetical protein
MFATLGPLFAGRGAALQKLLDGDPVAVTIFAVVVVAMIGVAVWKATRKKRRYDDVE